MNTLSWAVPREAGWEGRGWALTTGPGWWVKERGQSGGDSCPSPCQHIVAGHEETQASCSQICFFMRSRKSRFDLKFPNFWILTMNLNNNHNTPMPDIFGLCTRSSHGPLVYDSLPWSDYIAKVKVKIGLNSFVLIITHFKAHLNEWPAQVHFCGSLWPTQSHAQFLSSLYFWILRFLGLSKPPLLEMSTFEQQVPKQGVRLS